MATQLSGAGAGSPLAAWESVHPAAAHQRPLSPDGAPRLLRASNFRPVKRILDVLAAMACGVPVVASNAGGIPKIVENGRGGFTLPVGDTAAMAAAALHLLSDPEEMARQRIPARAHAVEFATATIVDRYEALYKRLLLEQGIGHRA